MSVASPNLVLSELQDMIRDGLIKAGPGGLEVSPEAEERLKILGIEKIELRDAPLRPTLH